MRYKEILLEYDLEARIERLKDIISRPSTLDADREAARRALEKIYLKKEPTNGANDAQPSRAHFGRPDDYPYDAGTVKDILLDVLGKQEPELTRGEQARINEILRTPRITYANMRKIIKGGWGGLVWNKTADSLRRKSTDLKV